MLFEHQKYFHQICGLYTNASAVVFHIPKDDTEDGNIYREAHVTVHQITEAFQIQLCHTENKCEQILQGKPCPKEERSYSFARFQNVFND